MELCPNVLIVVQFDELDSIIRLTYELNVSSSIGCELVECPMLLSTEQRNLSFILRDNVSYTLTLIVLNDCGSDSTTVTIQPEG